MTRVINRLLVLALVLAIAVPIAACGRKGAPDHPEGTEYPQQYPAEPKKP